MFIKVFCLTIFFTLSANAATIAIIDTGFDLDHEFLKPRILKQETDEEGVAPILEEFANWKFHDNTHLKKSIIKDDTLFENILRFRELRAKGHVQGLSQEEFKWFQDKSADKIFMGHVKKFKRRAHGTFVAGIALREGENIQIFPIRGLHIPIPVVAVNDESPTDIRPAVANTPIERFAKELKNSEDRVIRKFSKICRYLNLNKINIVNASYGITYKNTATRIQEKYKEIVGKPIPEEKLQSYLDGYFQNIFIRSEKVIEKYPNMLFVFSAGNSGLDNDIYPHYPSKIKLPNTLSVAALNGEYLANFSNYGKLSVDIAAQGVGVLSVVPQMLSPEGKQVMSPASGTSMAAPYIANLAAQIMNINSKLTPADVKRIIMETATKKDHLKERLISQGIVDNSQALKAAQLSLEMTLDEAITLGTTQLLPLEDSVSLKFSPMKDVLNSIPQTITEEDLDEITPTNESSSSPQDEVINTQDKKDLPPSTEVILPPSNLTPASSNQSEEQSLPRDEDLPSSSSLPEPQPLQMEHPETSPSSP